MAVVDGIRVKELHCKNDDCRKLLGYERIKEGILVFDCPRCKQQSIFKINFSKGQEIMETLKSMKELRGGE